MRSRKRSLRTQMLIQYAAIVLICLVVVPTFVAKTLDTQMKRFLERNLIEGEQEITRLIQGIYADNGVWSRHNMMPVYADLVRRPIVSVTLMDNEGQTIWEFQRADLRQKRHSEMSRGMMGGRRAPHMRVTANIVRESVIIFDERPVGKLRFAYMPFVDSREGLFIAQFSRRLFGSVGLVLVVAGLIAFIMANRISRPILKAANRASLISQGKYRPQEVMETNIKELQILIESMDSLELSLEAQEELRKRLMTDVAHELRSPLTIVKSHLEAFEDGIWSPTPERIKLTVNEIDRLSLLIGQIERLSSLESGEKRLGFSSANLSEELQKMAISLEPLFKEKNLSFNYEIEPDVTVAVDIVKLLRAVDNLLQNAKRYTDSGGSVTLSLKNVGGTVKISVADSGIGISEEDLPNIFERFYRADKSRARESGGMGIGLALAKATVKAHGGELSVESKEGCGSTFTVLLPLEVTRA